MFGIGFFELLIIGVFGLLIFGPEKLPEAIRTFAFAFAKFRRSWQDTKREFERELGMDDIRREIHNAQVLENLEKLNSNSILADTNTAMTERSKEERSKDEPLKEEPSKTNHTDQTHEPAAPKPESEAAKS